MNIRNILVALFVGTFALYSLSAYPGPMSDTTPARLLPFAILSGRGVVLDDFRFPYSPKAMHMERFGNHYISSYPMIVGIIATPFFVPTYAYLALSGRATPAVMDQYSYGLEKSTASLLSSVSVVLFGLLVWQITRKKNTVILLALVFACATPAYSISSRYLWQHGIAASFLIAALLLFLQGSSRTKGQCWAYVVSLALAVVAGWTRQVFFVFTLLLFGAVVWKDRRHSLLYAGVVIAGIVVFFCYNFYFYNTVVGTATESLTSFSSSHIYTGLLGLLFSPSRGLLFYTPFFLIAYAVPLYWKRIRHEPSHHHLMYIVLYLFFITHMCIHALFSGWWSGWSWGDRFFADTAPIAVLFVFIVYRYTQKTWIKVCMCILILYSFCIQMIGALYYPRGQWDDDYPVSYDVSPHRLWDIRDNPIVRNFAVGPDLRVLYGAYYWLLHIEPGAIPHEARACTLAFVGWKQRVGYHAARITLTNQSDTTWYTQGDNILTLRQMWGQKENIFFMESPVPSTPLPPIILPQQSVSVDVLMIPPSSVYDRVVITPVQEGVSWWTDTCVIELQP
jgi:hypothetical protein